MKNLKKHSILGILILLFAAYLTYPVYSQEAHQSTRSGEIKGNEQGNEIKDTKEVTPIKESKSTDPAKEKISIKVEGNEDFDALIYDYLTDLYPIISDDAIGDIQSSRSVSKVLATADTLGQVDFYLNFDVPKYYLEAHPKILWELNIPEFTSRIYQIVNNTDTVLITVWPNVVGKPSTRTFTGHYEAFRLRNWPTWKDPESGDSVRPTPPGPNNPLGLFVVHYDENSLRYFHGTNHNNLLENEYRALSHGCVRNDNRNVEKIKEFICKKVVVSRDISGWVGSKKSMTFEMAEEDKFPVRIMYKTFDVAKDSYGEYVEFFKDVYNYSKGSGWGKFDDPSLMTFTTVDAVVSEYKKEHPSNKIQDDKLIPIIEKLVAEHQDYQKYYFDELMSSQSGN